MTKGQFLGHFREAVEKFRDGVAEYVANADHSTETVGKRVGFYSALALASARDAEIPIKDAENPVCEAIVRFRNSGPWLLTFDELVAIEQAWEYYDDYQRAKELSGRRPDQIG